MKKFVRSVKAIGVWSVEPSCAASVCTITCTTPILGTTNMAELYHLKVHFNLLRDKIKNKWDVTKYKVTVNKYLKKVLIKLKEMNVIQDLKLDRSKGSFKLDNCRNIQLYHRPTEVINRKNYRKVVKQKLKDNMYNTLLISTSKGLKTLKEAVTQNIGGYVIGLITGKKPLYNQ